MEGSVDSGAGVLAESMVSWPVFDVGFILSVTAIDFVWNVWRQC